MIKFFLEYFHYTRVRLGLNRKSKLLRLLKKNKPNSILEIGVDEGKNALAMISILNRYIPLSKIDYTGIDLFSSLMTPEIAKLEASQFPKSKDDIASLLNLNFPELKFELIEGNSNHVLSRIEKKFDFIFIDGGHSYTTVKNDFKLCEQLLNEHGTIVLDDYTNMNSEVKAGYGVRSFINELDAKKYEIRLSRFPDLFWHRWGILSTRLVIIKIKKM
jgi:hypothetical protein